MPWTDEMVESLKKMWDEGLSTGEIGRRLGVSKNSIVGKVHRLQLVARPSPIKKKDENAASAPKAKAPTKPKAKTPSVETAKKAPKAEVKATTAAEVSAVAPSKPVEKPAAVKAPQKNNEADICLNVSIPVVHAPKKPGDKVTVTDLDNHTCRWPIGDPKDENFHFCGAAVRIGQTYCEEHAAIAYVKNIKK